MAEVRLIDGNALYKRLHKRANDYAQIDECTELTIREDMEIVQKQPTIDAVEVVRCKDCGKNGLFTCPICYIENKTLQFVNYDLDFYCGDGERK